ncbi:MAG TPA: response regulator [Kofleriaceae bacterium]|jgi:two-component system response regulator MprA
MVPLIVLAEDHPELRSLLASALEIIGYHVVPVGTGAHLLGAVTRLRGEGRAPTLVISDVRMPTLGGIDAARTLRATGDRVPLILMTAYGDAWTRREAASVDATLLDKPVRISALRDAVARALLDSAA